MHPLDKGEVLDDAAYDQMVGNVVGHLLDGVTEPGSNAPSSTGAALTRSSATRSKVRPQRPVLAGGPILAPSPGPAPAGAGSPANT